jgi:hypothetical protein
VLFQVVCFVASLVVCPSRARSVVIVMMYGSTPLLIPVLAGSYLLGIYLILTLVQRRRAKGVE